MKDINSRFKLLNPGQLPSPAQCAVCGTPSRPAVTWGAWKPIIGPIIICTQCFTEAVNELSDELGFVPLATYDKVVSEGYEDRVKVLHYEDIVNELSDSLAGCISVATTKLRDLVDNSVDSIEVSNDDSQLEPAKSEDKPRKGTVDLTDIFSSLGQDDSNAGDEGSASISASPGRSKSKQ